MKYKAYAATMQSVWFSEDEGLSWNRLPTPTGGFYNEARTWCVVVHKDRPGEVLTGSDQGLYRYTEEKKRFDYIPSPMDSLHIHQIAQDPHDPNFIVCGTRPGEIFISDDNGEHWTRSNFDASTECWFINTSRVTSIKFDPRDRDTIWVTVEIDGVFRSSDKGNTWELLIDGLHDNDTHGLVFRDYDDGSRQILCATEDGLHRSGDNGATWVRQDIPVAEWSYFRSIRQPTTNSDLILATVGDKPSGEASALLISQDYGRSWQKATFSHEPNSTLWSIGSNIADASLLFAVTIFGQIFKSVDGGWTWEKIRRELGEVRMITWAPT